MLEGLQHDGVPARLTLSLSAPLLTMLGDDLLRARYTAHLDQSIELAEKEVVRTRSEPHYQRLACMYRERFQGLRRTWDCHDGALIPAFGRLQDTHALILSMRGVPHIDMSGLEAIKRLHEQLHKSGTILMFAGVHKNAMRMMERAGLVEDIGSNNFFWSSDQAIVEAEARGCPHCAAEAGFSPGGMPVPALSAG